MLSGSALGVHRDPAPPLRCALLGQLPAVQHVVLLFAGSILG